MDGLYFITFAINVAAQIAAFWLGLYLVTRSPRVQTAWLTTFKLWSLGGLFLNIFMALEQCYCWLRYSNFSNRG